MMFVSISSPRGPVASVKFYGKNARMFFLMQTGTDCPVPFAETLRMSNRSVLRRIHNGRDIIRSLGGRDGYLV
jgi:hypothetical protein